LISFERLGEHGLGNQLFQYAFLRTTARRLGVSFHCPRWVGDQVFQLDDADERAPAPVGIDKWYHQRPTDSAGFEQRALTIEDGTDIYGYFQSERFFVDRDEVRGWYRFRNECVADVDRRHAGIDFSDSVGVHLRFGDKRRQPRYYLPSSDYYRRAVSLAGRRASIIVFSDEPARAKEHLRRLEGKLVFIEGNEAYEDLYLMSRCRASVCSVSTLSWWGAWLDPNPDKLVVVPKEGHFRPGSPFTCDSYWCDNWVELRGLRRVLTGYRATRLRFWLHPN
jgi:hypothetical protein